MLKPDFIIKLILPDLDLRALTWGSDPTNQTSSFFVEMRIFVFIIVLFGLLVLLLVILSKFLCLKSLMTKLLRLLKDKFIWNGIIFSWLISCMKVGMATSNNLNAFAKGNQSSTFELIVSVVATVVLCLTPMFILRFLYKNRDEIDEPHFRAKYQNLYFEIQVREGKTSFYTFFFL